MISSIPLHLTAVSKHLPEQGSACATAAKAAKGKPCKGRAMSDSWSCSDTNIRVSVGPSVAGKGKWEMEFSCERHAANREILKGLTAQGHG